MIVKFDAIGLDWVAEVAFEPGAPATWLEPPDPAEVEIVTLHNQRGLECAWVLESDEVREEIESAALAAAEEQWRRSGRRMANEP